MNDAVESKRGDKKGKAWARAKKDDLISALRKADEQSRTRNHDATATRAQGRRAVTQRDPASRH
jgi:hypothetical protein